MSEDVWGEIGRFDDEYRPDPGMRPGLSTLSDGDYEFTVLEADMSRTQNSGSPILKLWLRSTAGVLVEHVYFFDKPEKVNKLGSDLVILGFSDFEPGKRVPFSQALKAAMPKLRGVTFRARKLAEIGSDPQKPFHKLYIHGRVQARPGGAPTPAPAAAPVRNAAPAAAPSAEIPF